MRTTLTIDDELAARLKEKARRERLSFKDAVNAAIKAGLAGQDKPPRRRRFKVMAKRCGFLPGVDPGRLNQLLDELERDDFIAEASR